MFPGTFIMIDLRIELTKIFYNKYLKISKKCHLNTSINRNKGIKMAIFLGGSRHIIDKTLSASFFWHMKTFQD